MRLGVVFPQTELGTDPMVIRDYAQTAEELGYHHILTYEHVLGANPDRLEAWKGPYNYQDDFHEPFVLFSFMAAVTQRIEFVTGILILPQRQTAVVAKQAAALDVVSGGRLRLGVGVGWNWVEYEALSQNFRTRGRRIEEQIKLLRLLWTRPLVTFEGRWDTIPDAGIKPLPVQQPIPIWLGGDADVVLRRVAQMGDGWMPNRGSLSEIKPALAKLSTYLTEVGRSREDVGLEPRVSYGDGNLARLSAEIEAWREAGATHISVNTMRCGFDSPTAHLKTIRRLAELLELCE